MEEDGFVLVKKGRRRTKIDVVRADGTEEDVDNTMTKLLDDEDVAKMVDWCSSRLTSIVESRRISRILLLGNGHFDAKWETGAHQLALSMGLQKKYEAELIFQEPSCSASELAWLSKKNIHIRRERDVLINASTEDGDAVELVIFIHGLHSLLNDFLWHRWSPSLERIVFICNNYGQIDLIGGTTTLNKEYEALNVFRERASVVPFPSYAPSPSAFSGTSIMEMLPSLCSEMSALRLAAKNLQVVSLRNLPARGTKPLPRNLWDMKDLEEKTGGQYTHKPLNIKKLGGRDPETGRKVNQHIGGGVKFDYFMIDFHRRGPTGQDEYYDERVLEVRRDPNRTSHIALVAGAEGKRWILATENMTAGQIIRTTCHLSENPIIGIEGNSYPIGSLAAGTVINSVERFPTDESDVFIVKAGTAATIVRHHGDYTVVRLPHKHEFSLHKTCMATVGRLSHADIEGKIFGSAQMHRRFGYKMSSGLYHKKDGYFGRKIRSLPPVRVLDEPEALPPPTYQFSMTKDQLSGLHGHAKVHNLLSAGYTNRDYPE